MSLVLGIDTSNYKTSLALVDVDDNIIYDDRRFLRVPEGEKGLRQQDAFFQHVNRLPRMIKPLFETLREMNETIAAVSVSDKPRNVEESYMPCFSAGLSFAETIASALDVPIYKFSHQDGHIASGRRFTALNKTEEFIAFHFSGGTTEALKCNGNTVLEIIGGTKDISYGQLIDRIGVALGYPFPAGEEIDLGAIRAGSGSLIFNSSDKDALINGLNKANRDIVPKIKVDDTYINLSGTETAVLRYIEKNKEVMEDQDSKDKLSKALLDEISSSIVSMMKILHEHTGIKYFLFVGGVSASSYIRDRIEAEGIKAGLGVSFSSPDLASDNAVGIAFLGGDSIWR